jgi:hypothetical protein
VATGLCCVVGWVMSFLIAKALRYQKGAA